jgi:hypothetical protein
MCGEASLDAASLKPEIFRTENQIIINRPPVRKGIKLKDEN